MTKHLTKITDLSAEEIKKIIDKAFALKKEKKHPLLLTGKVIAMIFEKPSLRTKVAFEVAAHHLGAYPIFLTSNQILASAQNEPGRESIPDIARNLERFCDLILVRTYKHSTVQAIASSVKIPVINALCDQHHPTQALADLMAIKWHKKSWQNLKVTFIGDGNNVATSLMQICALLGVNFAIASPAGYEIPQKEQLLGKKLALKSGARLEFLQKPHAALKSADIVYTDTFISMGFEKEKKQRLKDFTSYQVTKNLLNKAKSDSLFMHCLPAHRGEEVTDEVMDSPRSIIFDQAECRLHIAKALLLHFLTTDSQAQQLGPYSFIF